MRRVPTLIEKLKELADQGKDVTVLDVDLMLDYTRVLYADLLEIRKVIPQKNIEIKKEEEPNVPNETPPVEETAIKQEDIAHEPEPPSSPEIKYPDIPDVDIRTQIGINDKYLYISELFANDKSAYDEAIKTLNTFSNTADATKWTEENLHNKYKWNSENETVISFYELLKSCFLST